MAYWAATQDLLYDLDLWMCLHDHAQAHGLGTEDEYVMDDALRWIAGVGANDEHFDDEVTIEHLPSLTHVRSLQPIPAYRDEDQILFGYLGYAESAEDDTSEEEGGGAEHGAAA